MGVLQHSNECKQWLLWRNHNIHDVINDLINDVTYSNHVNNSVNNVYYWGTTLLMTSSMTSSPT